MTSSRPRREAVAPTRKRMDAQARREVILKAAEHAFAEWGYADASMDEIARASGITKPVLYDHFSSKGALFVATAEAIRDELLHRGRATQRVDDAAERFRAGIDAFFTFVESRPEAARVLFVMPRTDAEAAKAAAAVQAKARAAIAAMLAPTLSDYAPWRREAIVLFLQRGLHALSEWWVENRKVKREELVSTVVGIVWTGLARR